MENEIININEFQKSPTDYNSYNDSFNQDEILIAYDQTYVISSIINEEIEDISQKETYMK